MEHISKHLPTVSSMEQTNCLPKSKGLLPEEAEIVELKYKAPMFSRMDPAALITTAKILLLKLHVITGWTIPADELKMILVDQFTKKLIESYPNVNAEEMEYAFRNNPGIKDWGKAMNLNLIDEVMVPYLERRLEVSRMEEHQKVKQIALPPAQVTDQEFIESVRKLYKLHRDYLQIPPLTYKCLGLQLTQEKKQAIKTLVNAILEEPTQDNYKQFACKLYFDGE